MTRVDPGNGTKSTIDLAICNTYMVDKIDKMDIDEKGEWKLKKYGKKVTTTDHNTIVVKVKVGGSESKYDSCSGQKRYNPVSGLQWSLGQSPAWLQSWKIYCIPAPVSL